MTERRCLVASGKTAARERFDRWAGSYERDRRSRLIAKPQREALAALSLQPNDRFLDVGCGTGAAVRAAAKVVDRAVGIDIAPAMAARQSSPPGCRAPNLFSGQRAAVISGQSVHGASVQLIVPPLPRAGKGAGGNGARAHRRWSARARRRDRRSAARPHRRSDLAPLRPQPRAPVQTRGAREANPAGFDEISVDSLWDGGYAIFKARRLGGVPASTQR